MTDVLAIDLAGAFALAPGSWRAPHPRRGLVPRADLVASLADAEGPLVVVTAPAGYGKTTTVLLWNQVDARPFAWVNLDRQDDDPVHLMRHVGSALEALAPLDPGARRVLEGLGRGAEAELAPAIASELARRTPLVLVMDDVHLLASEGSRRCLERLVDSVPAGSTVALVGRAAPPIRIPRRRMGGEIHEIDATELAMSTDEARELFSTMDIRLTESETRELVERTEGWPGGLHLAGMGIANRRDGSETGHGFTGRDRLVADYLVEEVLDTLEPDVVRFLERSSVLDHMNAELLDEVLEIDESGARLHAIETSGNLFLVPLDDQREWYRYHHLFGELLRARLKERDPRTFVALQRRASEILERAGDLDGAIEHAMIAGDGNRAASLVLDQAPSLVLDGRVGVLARWINRLGAPVVSETATGSLAKAWLAVGTGDAFGAEPAITRALEHGPGAYLSDGVTTVAVAAAVVRSIAGQRGLPGIVEDTGLVVDSGSEAMRPWWSLATTVRATALSMMGDIDEAADLFEAARPGVAELPVFAAGIEAYLALIALDRDDLPSADRHVQAGRRIREQHDLEAVPMAMVVFAADALVSACLGHRPDAFRDAAVARALLERVEDSVPRTALLGHVTLARTFLLVDDRAAARRHVELADRARRREPVAAQLNRDLDALHAQLDAADLDAPGRPALTAAELRVLPYLATHLSLKEIAAELIVSRNTTKSHAVSIYRKLGATSRSEAVDRATDLGLLRR